MRQIQRFTKSLTPNPPETSFTESLTSTSAWNEFGYNEQLAHLTMNQYFVSLPKFDYNKHLPTANMPLLVFIAGLFVPKIKQAILTFKL